MKGKLFKGMFYRDFKLYRSAVLRALVLTLLFALLCGGAAYAVFGASSEEEGAPLTVAVVDKDDSILSRIALRMVLEDETLKKLLAVERTDEEEAREGIKSGKYNAALILPQGYLDSISTGKTSYGTVLKPGEILRNGHLIKLATTLGERMINAGQYGVFAAEEIVLDQEDSEDYYDRYILSINDALLSEMGKAGGGYYTTEETAFSYSSLSLFPHTALIYILFLLELCTLFFYRNVTADLVRSIYGRLCSCGVDALTFLLPKIVYSFLYRALLAVVAFGVCALFIPLKLTFGTVLLAVLAIVFFAAVGTFCCISFYGNRYGIAALSALYIGSIFLSGGILPLFFLSEKIVDIGKLTPLGVGYQLTAPLFGTSFEPTALVVMGFWLMLTGALAVRSLQNLVKKEDAEV